MRRLAFVTAVICSVLAATLGFAPGASAANDLSCTISGATAAPLGATVTFDTTSCGSPRYSAFSLVTAAAGSVVTLDVAPNQLVSVALFAPGTTDFNLDAAVPLCRGLSSGMYEVKCQLSRTGTWVIAVGDWLDSGSGTLNTSLSLAPAVAGQATGSCMLSTSPSAPSRVKQYADGLDCYSAHDDLQFWHMTLYRGDRLHLAAAQLVGQNNYGDVQLLPRGTTDYTWASTNAICDLFVPAPAGTTCPTITGSGTYYLSVKGGEYVIPAVTHAVTNTLVKASQVGVRHTYVVTDKLTSPAGTPSATCVLQVRTTVWKTVRTVRSSLGVCRMTTSFTSRGYKTLRVLEKGATGWASHTLTAFRVRVV